MSNLTLEDIAEQAGVSRSTVSRVVNDLPNVSEDVRRRVLDVIQQTGYHPNAAARTLAGAPRPKLAELDGPTKGRLITALETMPAVVRTDTSAAPKSTNSMARSLTLRVTLRARRSLTEVGCMLFIEFDRA